MTKNAERIARTARTDVKVKPVIQPVAKTNLLAALRALRLSAREWDVISFLIERDGTYASSQRAMARALKMSVRTLSRAQRGMAEKGLIALAYTGRLTRYKIRPEGVQMALKSASSKGYAKNGVSIEYTASQKVNLEKQDTSAEAGGGTPPPPPQDRIQLVATQPGGLAGAAQPGAGVHPEFMRGHPPRRGWRDNPNLKPAQRMVCLWKELTGRLATPQEKGLLGAVARETQEPEALLAWAVRHWNLVGDGVMDAALKYPAEPSLLWLRKNVGKYQRAFYMESRDLEFLATDRARTARQGWRESHRKSEWRDDEGWRTGPRAEEIEDLLIAGRREEARAIIHALGEAWRDGPHAGEIGELLARGKRKEAEALMRESNQSWHPSADKMGWLAAGEKVQESWRIGPHAEEIEDLLARGKRKEAEAMMIKDFGQWKGGPHGAKIRSLLLRGRTDEAEALIKQTNMEAAEAETPAEGDK